MNAKSPYYRQASNVVTGPEIWDANGGKDTGETPLDVAARASHAAARSGASDVVRILVNVGVPVDSRDDFRETPLHQAVNEGRTETADLILQLGADVNARNRRGHTPLYYAERERDPRFDFLDRVDRSPVAAFLRSRGGIK